MADSVDAAAAPLPSGDAVDAPVAPPQQQPPPLPSDSTKAPAQQQSVGGALAAAPYKVDAFIAHLFRCIQSRSHTDAVLMFFGYSCHLAGAVLDAGSRASLQHAARKLVALAFQLPPSTTVVLTSTPTPPLTALALKLAARLKAMAALISEMRTMGRLLSLFTLYMAGRSLLLRQTQKPAKDESEAARAERRFDTAVSCAQVAALISHAVNENVVLLSTKKVLSLNPATQKKMALRSVRSWAVYVGLEIGKLLVERARRGGTGAAAQDEAATALWRKNLINNLSWAPLTVNWSLASGGPLHEILICLFAMVPATNGMVDLWRQTA
ncbi:hypothetical protein S40285_00504 [Stachybotrys chlorohalonatus IBT 40285]|uniref:Peroxin 11C n=1 Tax=Stachybotrys chlorohalonatus (strain IBT 40285) TaxID=1283841 RepID=A0A084QNE4_STAC4|nr:hypothetical protein S40285_00504 [Stachybotrys chlorohalonata IBT 40285]